MPAHLFFGYMINPASLGGQTAVLLLSALLGGLIGLERQWHGTPAGLRTHMLVCIGSTVITLTSVAIDTEVAGGLRGDPARLAAQIVSGIGFLGAGAILRSGTNVHGLTTAASIWATAGIGIALGVSPHLGQLAVIATLIVLATLFLLARVETLLHLKQNFHTLDLEIRKKEGGRAWLLDLLQAQGVIVYGTRSDTVPASQDISGTTASQQMHLQVSLPNRFHRQEFNKRLLQEDDILAFHLD